jgi:hypothetical protein
MGMTAYAAFDTADTQLHFVKTTIIDDESMVISMDCDVPDCLAGAGQPVKWKIQNNFVISFLADMVAIRGINGYHKSWHH